MKKIWCVCLALWMSAALLSCSKQEVPTREQTGGFAPLTESSQAAAPDQTLSANLKKLLESHATEGWYRHIEKAEVFHADGSIYAEITVKSESSKYAAARAMLAQMFQAEELDAFFPGLCGAAEELGLSSADVAEIGKLFNNLTTQDDAQNYERIAQYGLPVYQLLADITGEKVSKIKADIDARIVDDAKVAEVLFQALEETYAVKSKEITQAEMTQVSSVILTGFKDAAIGKIIFMDPDGTVMWALG